MLKRTEMIDLCNQVIAESDFDRRHALLRTLIVNLVDFTNEHGLPEATSIRAATMTPLSKIDLSTVSDQLFPIVIVNRFMALNHSRNPQTGHYECRTVIKPDHIKKEQYAFSNQWANVLRNAWSGATKKE